MLCIDSKKSKFIKEQKASRLLSSLRIKTPLSKISLVVPFLFKRYSQVNTRCKMNEIVNKILLAGDQFMSEMQDSLDLHIVFLDYSQKTKKEYKYLKKHEIHDIFIKTNWIKLVLWKHDIVYEVFKDLTRRAIKEL